MTKERIQHLKDVMFTRDTIGVKDKTVVITFEEARELIELVEGNDAKERKCEKCGGRLALVSGHFDYEADDEPYTSGVVEYAKVEDGSEHIHGFKCDDCNLIQKLWNE